MVQRQKQSKSSRALEEAGLKAAGVKTSLFAPVIIVLALLLVLFILLKLKILTWCLLILLNVVFLAYLIHLMNENSGGDKVRSAEPEAVYHSSPERAKPVKQVKPAEGTKIVSSKKIFV